MYTTKYHETSNILEINNPEGSVYGKIYLNLGASLQELTLDGHKIIQDLSPLSYGDTYASSILFPFANRIKDGTYKFEGKTFQFEKNQVQEQNALHGLVYNKTFGIIDEKLTENSAMVSLEYTEKSKTKGFPYTYTIRVGYTFKKNALDVKVSVHNTDNKAFPFTLGWHPYFISSDLKRSKLHFDSTEKVVLGDRNITTGTEKIKKTGELPLDTESLDDCWILNSDEVIFKTPDYNLRFNATGNNNFLQAYIPPRPNTIAIEPTTGISDSFNNKIGLATLAPDTSYSILWQLTIIE